MNRKEIEPLALKIARRLYKEQNVLIEALISLAKEKDKKIEYWKNRNWCCEQNIHIDNQRSASN